MFSRVTALHFACFLPSLGEIAPLTAEVSPDEHGDLIPTAVYRQSTGGEVPAEDRARALECAMDACALLQDTLVSAADKVASALRYLIALERSVHEAAQEAETAARVAGLGSVQYPLDGHKDPTRATTPGVDAMERYAAHLAESTVPEKMLQKATEAEEEWAARRAEEAVEDGKWEAAEHAAEVRAERLERMGRP